MYITSKSIYNNPYLGLSNPYMDLKAAIHVYCIRISRIIPILFFFIQIIRLILIILHLLCIIFDIHTFLECLIVVNNGLYDDNLTYIKGSRDMYSYYPWLGQGADKFSGPGGGPPTNGPENWPACQDNYRKDKNGKSKGFAFAYQDILKQNESIEEAIEKRFGPQEQRWILDTRTGAKMYFNDITSIETIGSERFRWVYSLKGPKFWTEYGLTMYIYTNEDSIFNRFNKAVVMFPGNNHLTVNDESTFIKLILRQRDVAGLYYFENGTGEPKDNLFKLKRIYGLKPHNPNYHTIIPKYNNMFNFINNEENSNLATRGSVNRGISISSLLN